MKIYKLLLAGIFFMLLSVNLFAQDQEMTEEEWQNEINRLTESKVALASELNSLKAEIANLKKMRDGLLNTPYYERRRTNCSCLPRSV